MIYTSPNILLKKEMSAMDPIPSRSRRSIVINRTKNAFILYEEVTHSLAY